MNKNALDFVNSEYASHLCLLLRRMIIEEAKSGWAVVVGGMKNYLPSTIFKVAESVNISHVLT